MTRKPSERQDSSRSTVVEHSPYHHKIDNLSLATVADTGGLYYKTFYGRNFWIFVIS